MWIQRIKEEGYQGREDFMVVPAQYDYTLGSPEEALKHTNI